MPAGIYTGQQAKDVAQFVAAIAGQQRRPGPAGHARCPRAAGTRRGEAPGIAPARARKGSCASLAQLSADCGRYESVSERLQLAKRREAVSLPIVSYKQKVKQDRTRKQ